MSREPELASTPEVGGVTSPPGDVVVPPPDEDELERVREIILEPDLVRRRLRQPEVE